MSEHLTIAFVGYTAPDRMVAARAFEDEVLTLLPEHGARVVSRVHRRSDQADELPAEIHVLRFPSRTAFDNYLRDPRRAEIIERHGEVFEQKTVIEVDEIV